MRTEDSRTWGQGNSNECSDGITIDNCTFMDGYYVTIQGNVDNLTVKNSVIENCKSGIGLQAGTTWLWKIPILALWLRCSKRYILRQIYQQHY